MEAYLRDAVFFLLNRLLIDFPFFWLFLVGAIITLGTLKNRKTLSEAVLKKFERAFFFCVIAFFVSVISLALLSRTLLKVDFDRIFGKPIQNMEFSVGENRIQISDQKAVQEFIQLIQCAREIGAHHSHPVNELHFIIPGSNARFSLGPDSTNADEFWLKMENPELYGKGEFDMKQFHSPSMTGWLKKYVQ